MDELCSLSRLEKTIGKAERRLHGQIESQLALTLELERRLTALEQRLDAFAEASRRDLSESCCGYDADEVVRSEEVRTAIDTYLATGLHESGSDLPEDASFKDKFQGDSVPPQFSQQASAAIFEWKDLGPAEVAVETTASVGGGGSAGANVDRRPVGSWYSVDYHEAALKGDTHEPVPFTETVWNVALVLGTVKAANSDRAISLFLLLMNTYMQLVFAYIAISSDFLGSGIGSEKQGAADWRLTVAHDHTYMDFREVSLVNRVCKGDETLILSNGQARMVKMINSYLGLHSDPSHPDYFEWHFTSSPGHVLCFVCLLFWVLYVCDKLRSNFLNVLAILRLPRSSSTQITDGRVISISCLRLFALLFSTALRTCISFILLYSGIIWLSGTLQVQQLVLNAVALGAILDIDTIAFRAMMPITIKLAIQELEAVKVKYSKLRSQIEAGLILLCVVALCTLAWIFLLWPLANDMREVKWNYCGGNQNFVVAENSDTQMVYAFETQQEAKTGAILRKAVEEAIKLESVRESRLLAPTTRLDDFVLKRTRTMEAEAALGRNSEEWACMQTNFTLESILNDPDGSDFIPVYLDELKLFRNVKLRLGMEHATVCEDLADFCSFRDNRLLRLVCPRTCGCTDPFGNRFFRTQKHGCRLCSKKEAADQASSRACADMHNPGDGWKHFWDTWANNTVYELGMDTNSSAFQLFTLSLSRQFQERGCTFLQGENRVDPYSGASWCDGGPEFEPLRFTCPETCGYRE